MSNGELFQINVTFGNFASRDDANRFLTKLKSEHRGLNSYIIPSSVTIKGSFK